MAGFFPDVPGHRMPYDRDGSAFFSHPEASSVVTEGSVGDAQAMNDESNSGYTNWGIFPNHRVGVLFPELRDVVGFYVGRGAGILDTFQWSANTTSGYDGDWTTSHATFASDGPENFPVSPTYRTNIVAASITGAKAVKFRLHGAEVGVGGWLYAFHLFGSIAAGQNPDRLRFWHPTLDQEVTGAYFDWGDVPRSSTATRTFRIKNNSATLTGNSIVVGREALTDTAPTVVGQHELSNGGAYATTQNIGALAPGVISSVLTVRRTTPADAALSTWALRLKAEAGSWT